MRKDISALLRLTRESSKTMAMAATHIVATSEVMKSLNDKLDGIVDDAAKDSKVIGITETRVATKQEILLDIQIQNAKATRVQIVMVIIGMLVTATLGLLGFLKWYVRI